MGHNREATEDRGVVAIQLTMDESFSEQIGAVAEDPQIEMGIPTSKTKMGIPILRWGLHTTASPF